MSKIYEALQRAEAERKAGIEPPAPPSAHDPAETRVPSAAADAPQTTPPQPAVSQAPAAPASVRQPIGGVVTRWAPVVDKLPALGERGSAVEQFRSLRSRLMTYRDNNPLKSLLISSGLPREGKSFIAANLAVSLARHKASRVLLIDGDMRRSSLHELLGCPSKPGLSTFLAGKATLAEVIQKKEPTPGMPLLAGLESLSFMPAGDEGDKAGDLSGSARFRELITQLGAQFDWIIVDSSPVNLVTDGVNLAGSCDAVLLVARGGVTRFETAQKALAELKASRVVGVVLNAVDVPPQTDGYYGYDRAPQADAGGPSAA